jgi:hypothetical protein
MNNDRLEFEYIPQTPDNVRIAGSLVFDRRSELGPRAYLDLTGIETYQILARDCIAALYQHTSPSRVASDLTIGSYSTIIRELLDYCGKINSPSQFCMMDITYEFLMDYRAYLQLISIDFKSEYSRRRFGNIIRLLEAGRMLNLARPDFSPPRSLSHKHDNDRVQPYTASEALDFESICRTKIREMLSRLDKGKELLAIGEDPRGRHKRRDPATGAPLERPWLQLKNIIWYIVNVMDGQYLDRSQLLAGRHSTFNNVMMGCFDVPYRKKDTYSLLYPLTWDLIPFIILLAKKTGRNEHSILELTRDCLQEIDERFILWYEKARGSARRYKKYIDNDGPFSPVALIKTLLKITEPLVQHAPTEDREYLFLGLTIDGHGREPVKRIDPSYIKFQMNHDGGWCDQHELKNEHAQPLRVSLRRWRVYYLTSRYKQTGQLSRVSRDAAHTLGTTTVDYIANDATRHIHEQAVREALYEARALASPKILTDENPETIATTLDVDITSAEKIINGEQDVLFSSCKDFYNRPGGKLNTPCDKPWGCFVCSNSVITRHVLPRVIVLRDFIQQARNELSAEDWNTKFGSLWHSLTIEVLPLFSREAIAEAEHLAQSQIFYIPLNMRT